MIIKLIKEYSYNNKFDLTHNKMGDNLFSLIKGCSESSKENIKKFLQELLSSDHK